MIRIAFVTPTLSFGGAQMMLVKLISQIDREIFKPEVFSLTNKIPLAERVEALGIPVHRLGMKVGVPDPRGLLSLAAGLKKFRPDVVNTWMYHADLLGTFAGLLSGRPPVIWNIRHSNLNSNTDKASTILTAKTCAHLSKYFPKAIVCCAKSARDIHVDLGYHPSKFQIIPNGFDLHLFHPDPVLGLKMREKLGLSSMDFVIGLVARFHPQKDHKGFIKAAGILSSRYPLAKFLLCGDEITWENKTLSEWIHQTGDPNKFILLGPRSDIPALTAALDIGCSSSACGEAFSNTLGEAMACGIPCVATSVGDAAEIIGDTGLTVAPEAPEELAAAWEKMILLSPSHRNELGMKARQRICEIFSLDRVTLKYEELFASVVAEGMVKGQMRCQKS